MHYIFIYLLYFYMIRHLSFDIGRVDWLMSATDYLTTRYWAILFLPLSLSFALPLESERESSKTRDLIEYSTFHVKATIYSSP